jgi:sortase A
MSIFNREKPIINTIKQRQPRKPIQIALDALIIIIAVIGLFLIIQPLYLHWQQDKASQKLEQEFDNGDGTIIIRPDEYVVPGEDIEYLTENEDEYDLPPSQTDETILTEPTEQEPEPEEIVVKAIGRMIIDRIDLKMPVAEGSTKYNLRVAIGHYSHSADAGQPGLSIYLGHRMYNYGRHFNRLDELVENDSIVIETKSKRYTYKVDGISVIEPKQLYEAFNEQTNGESRILLVTCTPVRVASHRLLIHGQLVDTADIG